MSCNQSCFTAPQHATSLASHLGSMQPVLLHISAACNQSCFTSQQHATSLASHLSSMQPVSFHISAAYNQSCFTSRQHATSLASHLSSTHPVRQGWLHWHTQTEVTGQTGYLIQSQYTDPTQPSPITRHVTSGVWQAGHYSLFSFVSDTVVIGLGFQPQPPAFES